MLASIVAQYEERRALYERFCLSLHGLVEDILVQRGFVIHSVTSRTKGLESLAEKVARPGKKYTTLEEITDLVGVRVIARFADDVDEIAHILREEFAVDADRSVDKRAEREEHSFGYQSLHLVGQLCETRSGLAEYSVFGGLNAEFQVRSILQHSWAEIEHDLGYKSSAGVPRPIRRRFARLSALLELADDEFARVRDELADYSKRVEAIVLDEPETVGVDTIALEQFLSQSRVVESLADRIESALGVAPYARSDPFWMDSLPGYFAVLNVSSIRELETLLEDLGDSVVRNWELIFPGPNHRWTVDMILFALVLIATVHGAAVADIDDTFERLRIGPPEGFVAEVRKSDGLE